MKQTEADFLAQYDPSAFERPSVATDVAMLTVRDGALQVLLVQRAEHPFLGAWSLPGGFVKMDEALDAAARRLLATKGGVEGVYLEQYGAFGALGRDPRTRVIAVLYFALVPPDALQPPRGGLFRVALPPRAPAGTPAQALDGDTPLPLAFDHAEMLGAVVRRLRENLTRSPMAYALLPERFSLRQLHAVYEAVLGRTLNYPAFRRKVMAAGVLLATGAREEEVGHRPAELFRYVPGELEDDDG